MRKLTKSQKQLLDKYEVWDVNDLPTEVLDKLSALNDYETMWQDANRYLWDRRSETHSFVRKL